MRGSASGRRRGRRHYMCLSYLLCRMVYRINGNGVLMLGKRGGGVKIRRLINMLLVDAESRRVLYNLFGTDDKMRILLSIRHIILGMSSHGYEPARTIVWYAYNTGHVPLQALREVCAEVFGNCGNGGCCQDFT